MFDNLTKRLGDLVCALDFLRRDQAIQVLDAVAQGIQKEITSAYIIDVLWYEGVIANTLQPLSSIGGRRGSAKPKGITDAGIWARSFEKKQEIWIEDIPDIQKEEIREKAGYINITSSVVNKASPEHLIESKDLRIWGDTSAILLIPLIYSPRGKLVGLYSIELDYGSFNNDQIRGLRRLAPLVAAVVWKYDVDNHVKGETTDAIRGFKDAIDAGEYLTREDKKVGFMARPFDAEGGPNRFLHVEQYLNTSLHKVNAHVKSFQPKPGSEYVAHDLINNVKKAHFAIVDLTEVRPNVVFELGLITMSLPPWAFMRIKERTCRAETPFDLSVCPRTS